MTAIMCLRGSRSAVPAAGSDRDTLIAAFARLYPEVPHSLVEISDREIGEVWLESDSLFEGYQRDPELSARMLVAGWLNTGDRGYLDADGWLYFVDRKKDAIRRRGENISSFEVEQIILKHPAVLEVAAFPVASEHSEDEVMVAVVPLILGVQLVLDVAANLDRVGLGLALRTEHDATALVRIVAPRVRIDLGQRLGREPGDRIGDRALVLVAHPAAAPPSSSLRREPRARTDPRHHRIASISEGGITDADMSAGR